MTEKKQFCSYCHEDKCSLDCEICNPPKDSCGDCTCSENCKDGCVCACEIGCDCRYEKHKG